MRALTYFNFSRQLKESRKKEQFGKIDMVIKIKWLRKNGQITAAPTTGAHIILIRGGTIKIQIQPLTTILNRHMLPKQHDNNLSHHNTIESVRKKMGSLHYSLQRLVFLLGKTKIKMSMKTWTLKLKVKVETEQLIFYLHCWKFAIWSCNKLLKKLS